MQTLILCAGLGTRLRPLTCELPKPLVPVGDRPLLSHLLEAVAGAGGVLRAVNAHHLSDKIVEFINVYDPTVHVSVESQILGTAGGVQAALAGIAREPLLICNADIITTPNVAPLLRALDAAPLALAVEIVAAGTGNVGLDDDGRIVRLRQQCIGRETMGGLYVGHLAMRPECFDVLPEQGCLIGDVAIPMLLRNARIIAVPHAQRWTDIGHLRAYLAENLRWLRNGKANHGSSWVAPTANVAPEVALEDALVGPGAVVRGHGRLERVVVWPGATVTAPLVDAVVTPVTGPVSVS